MQPYLCDILHEAALQMFQPATFGLSAQLHQTYDANAGCSSGPTTTSATTCIRGSQDRARCSEIAEIYRLGSGHGH